MATNAAHSQQWMAVRLHPPTAQFSQAYAVSAAQQGGSLRDLALLSDLPVIWQSTSVNWTPLASGTGITGEVFGMWENTQVGDVSGHAALWLGTPQSRTDLQPVAAVYSYGLATRTGMQAGWVFYPGNVYHAALWYGTAASFVDLHPAGAVRSYAYATDGVRQGGVAWFPVPTGTDNHAALWNGTAQSFVDLSPGGLPSDVRGMARGVQVGDAFIPGAGYHAAIWHGSAQSFVDFNGSQLGSRLFGTTGRIHVGQGGTSPVARAIINFGTPGAWLELHQFLPSGYNSFSGANAVYQDGAVIYVGGYAVSNASGENEAFLWIGADPCYPNCDQSTVPPMLNVLDFGCFLNAFASGEGYANCDTSTTPPVLNILDFVCFINRFAAGCS
jgi:hypothetical protein